MGNRMATKVEDFVSAFEVLGFYGKGVGPDDINITGPCPFCGHTGKDGKTNYFSLNKNTGQWKCFFCSEEGNLWTIMTRLSQRWFDATTNEKWRELAQKRGIPSDAWKRYRWCWDGASWVMPVWNEQGTFVRNIYRWDEESNKVISMPKPCQQELLGQDDLVKAPRNATVWVCYSKDTEVLTETGWKLFTQLKDEKVAQYNLWGEISFVKPRAKQKFRYKGEMIHLKSRWSDLLVTPNHRVLCKYSNHNPVVVPASTIREQRKFPVAGYLTNKSNETITPEQVQVLVAYIADGCKTTRGDRVYWSFKKKRKIKRLRSLLTDAGITWREWDRLDKRWGMYTHFSVSRKEIPFILPHYDKKIHREVLQWSLVNRATFIEELQYWDGDGSKNYIRYFTSHKENADLVSELASISGWGCGIRDDDRKDSHNYIVSLHRTNWRMLTNVPVKKPYNGYVYCCTVDTGFIVVRRNGKTMISGNCEGHWDLATWRWLLDKTNRAADFVVGVPGTVCKPEWMRLFSGRKVRLLFDNDRAGDEGSEKWGERLGKGVEVRYLSWPETLATGYDLRDFVRGVNARKQPPQEALQQIEKMLTFEHRRAKQKSPILKQGSPPEKAAPGTINPVNSFKDVVKAFAKWTPIDDEFVDALAISLAVCLGNEVPGDPLWVYLVGPPSSGKTKILAAMKDSPRVALHSTVTSKSLVSGWAANGGKTDPSLLPKLDGLTAIFKDGTELFSLPDQERTAVYSILRGAYDGSLRHDYANGISRDYTKIHFNLLIGTTTEVHGDSQASKGERFLKVELGNTTHEEWSDKVDAAIDNVSNSTKMDEELCGACRVFLERNIDPLELPALPAVFKKKINALSQFVAILRSQVKREQYGERDLVYRPKSESPMRLAGQLAKLARLLCCVFDKKEVDREIYQIVRKVGFDTCINFQLDVALLLLRENKMLPVKAIAERINMPIGFTTRKLQDMEHLGIVAKIHDPSAPRSNKLGPVPWCWRMMDRVIDLWKRSKVFGDIQTKDI